ncbi:universal stress protein [Halalkalibacter akibai]|uniref:Universal stress protein n=1 Tax=Halalkalibacter akibai (strain ATCC 43226 / DSM 21942 / CIP 109018 / JCM 9157 / 1139) TaxID=1236973 RepID=W4QT83_HALA3|nr:universal stress protein [Halalkalibacter akibai]GAE34843.1 universal stress protein family [Halalkalibacter akibai JCM 9157]
MAFHYQTILVAVDGSTESELALKKAFKMAKLEEAKLVISYIIDNRPSATIEQYDRTIVEQTEKYGQEMLITYKKDAEEAGILDVEIALDYGSPKIKIPRDIADKYQADLIIAGATGINAVERLFIGSVSENIARRAKCDVLIVRKQH